MSSVFTFILLAAVTVLAVRRYWRKAGVSMTRRADTGSRCPRCSARIPEKAIRCPACRVPLQVFELVTLGAVTEAEQATAHDVRPHGVVRADVCVGCGTCVDACPVDGAIRLEDKRAVIDLGLCTGHGHCAEACPVGAIVMATGDAVQRVEVPLVDLNFESNIRGLYIVGELGGRGLIKNAINEARLAVEHIDRKIDTGWARDDSTLDVVVVGSGPAGLSAGLEAHRRGLSYVVLERGDLADTIRKYPRNKLLLSEPVRVPLYGDLWIADASKESLLKVWEKIIRDTGLDVRTGHDVVAVQSRGHVFEVTAADKPFLARNVVLATGRRGSPRRLGVPGEELGKAVYDIVEMEEFKGKRVLVVGGGDSAVESALGLSRQDGT
ncbi:MAG: NAD(P)-binding domain-containing protein, partial [Acidobacteriota bacterium]